MERIKKISLSLAFAVLTGLCFWGLTVFSGEVAAAVREAVLRCVNVMVPSLFAVTAVSSIVMSSGLYRYAALTLRPIAKYIFRLPDELFAVLILSNVSGYPIGIKLLSELYEKGLTDKQNAELMACCCYCGGPAFYTSAIGLAVFGDIKCGVIVFASVAGANLFSAIIIGHIFKPKIRSSDTKLSFSGELISSAVMSAGRTMLTVCAFIVAFSVPTAIIDSSGIIDRLCEHFGAGSSGSVLIRSCLEISNISGLRGTPYGLLPFISAICSFGGLCIVFQLGAVRSSGVSLVPFLISRVPLAAISFLISLFLRRQFLPTALPAFSVKRDVFVKIDNFTPSFCLIMLILLLNLKRTLAFSKRV